MLAVFRLDFIQTNVVVGSRTVGVHDQTFVTYPELTADFGPCVHALVCSMRATPYHATGT